jgi:hypothetical protein
MLTGREQGGVVFVPTLSKKWLKGAQFNRTTLPIQKAMGYVMISIN